MALFSKYQRCGKEMFKYNNMAITIVTNMKD